MREELAPYLRSMESVKMLVKVEKYLHYKMDGVSNLTVRDPATQLITPMFFANPLHLEGLEKYKFGNSPTQTLVKPLTVNDIEINDIDHMIVWCDLSLPIGAECEIFGYISGYVRRNETEDYCICS